MVVGRVGIGPRKRGWLIVFGCRDVLQNVNGGHQTGGTRVVIKRATGNIFELLIAYGFGFGGF
jgi:hypothetical protein